MPEDTFRNTSISDKQIISEEISRVFDLQRVNSFKVNQTKAKERIAKLRKLQKYIISHKKDIRKAVYDDFRKPAEEVDLSEIFVVTAEIKHAIRHLKSWMKPQKVEPTMPMLTTKSYIIYEPKGISLIISPWNFPFNLSVGPLVSAIAAGNCVILKPSEISPNTSRFIAKMIDELFHEDEITVFEGGKGVAHQLLKKPFDHIFFTGSSAIGKIIMQEASNNLSTITLELGGKSPVIIDETANLKDAVEKITWGKFINAGQTCIAPDYLFIHHSRYDKFTRLINKKLNNYYGETAESKRENKDFARVINERHFDRLTDILEQSLKEGARIIAGGEFDKAEHYIAPTVISNVSLNTPLMKEEIFGPILPVLPYRTLDDVISIINSRPKPLALYIFSKNKKHIRKIISQTSAGGSCINDVLVQFMHQNLPFGGSNYSGFGKSHGFFGFKEFSHQRAILRQSRFSPFKLLYPPYTKRVRTLINLVMKYF
ncbi:MAG TPA: aldehyde dehydrogenase family protein [Balneolales bacterium]|nr:aldehyde dehydrogenase family protein [Balneolales bacterium]